MDEMLKILRINTYIQLEQGRVYLDGKEIIVVSLDRSWATKDNYDSESLLLTDEQLDDLFRQTFVRMNDASQ